MKIVLGVAKTLTAFDEFGTVGTKVIDGPGEFQHLLTQEIKKLGDFKGAHSFDMPTDAYHLVRPGEAVLEGLRDEDKFKRMYTGVLQEFAKAEFAIKKVESLGVYVMTLDAYLEDPDVIGDDAEIANQLDAESTHIMVAIHSPSNSPLSYERLGHNISGGNADYVLKSKLDENGDLTHSDSDVPHDLMVAHKMVFEAKRTVNHTERITVAEPAPLTQAEKNRLDY